jgi:hypothetical protein
MRDFDAATLAYLDSPAGCVVRQMVYIRARSVSTGVIEALGLWSGLDDLAITIDGEARTYSGAGSLLRPDPVVLSPGLDVRIHRVTLDAVSPEVEDLVKGYVTRFAPIEIHRALIDPETRLIVAPPVRVVRGWIDSIVFPEGAIDGNPACEIDIARATRALTRPLSAVKSNAAQSRRGGDPFRKYGDISGAVPVYWGESYHDGPGGVSGGSDRVS